MSCSATRIVRFTRGFEIGPNSNPRRGKRLVAGQLQRTKRNIYFDEVGLQGFVCRRVPMWLNRRSVGANNQGRHGTSRQLGVYAVEAVCRMRMKSRYD